MAGLPELNRPSQYDNLLRKPQSLRINHPPFGSPVPLIMRGEFEAQKETPFDAHSSHAVLAPCNRQLDYQVGEGRIRLVPHCPIHDDFLIFGILHRQVPADDLPI